MEKNKPIFEKEVEVGRISLEGGNTIVVRATRINGKDFLDIRLFVTTENYKGFTTKGVFMPITMKDELIDILLKV